MDSKLSQEQLLMCLYTFTKTTTTLGHDYASAKKHELHPFKQMFNYKCCMHVQIIELLEDLPGNGH